MNQILMTENRKKSKTKGPIEIKAIVRFFAIVILIFGIGLVGEGSYAMYKNAEDKNPSNMPKVTVSRLNDTAILNVTHSVEISTITYAWDDGESTVLPQGGLTAQEEILLPNQDSVLNITIEDMNGKKVQYQKQYHLEGMDITKPTITIDVANGSNKMKITAIDETEIKYMSYNWDGEEKVTIEADAEGQTKIEKEINLTPGTKKINVIAEDKNGNIEQIQKEIVATTSEPKMQLIQNGKNIIIEASDEDGIRDIAVTLNGKRYETKQLNLKYVQVGPVELQEGNNTILVEVTNVSGYTKKAATEIKY